MEYGAIDLHTKHSQIRIVTADGTLVFKRRPAPVRDALAVPLREAEAWARQAAAAARRLMTVPGVGPVTALSYRATLDRVERFPDAGRATAYLGLVPRENSSAEWAAGARSRCTPGSIASRPVEAGASPSSPSPGR